MTFLFTDIEGSTRLSERHPRAYQAALARHHTLLRQAIEAYGGTVFETVGDAVYAAFPRAADAVAAALGAQRELYAEPWGELGPLRVRMAVHTGDVELLDGGHYVGPPLFRAARLMAIGHGGQVLVSGVTAAHVRGLLPAGAGLKDLGRHRLKDLGDPEQVFQLLHPDLQRDFTGLRSLKPVLNNLPLQVTSFVGRQKALAEITRLLGTTQLLTLTGAGGSGKTRLALQAGAELLDRYADGVWFVELAGLADSQLVPQAVAACLGVREDPTQPMLTTLVDALASKQLLLILDNCEHLVEACARVAEMLIHTCPHVRLLVTSREVLNIAGETAWRVPPLALADPNHLSVEALTECEAVRLFVERATAVQPAFTVTDQNALAIAQICSCLDGIPLAIELAAARTKILSADQIAVRLDDRFRLLTSGNRTALPRQQTLRGALDWSYELLSRPERRCFERLSVFVGGWTVEAAEAVCAEDAAGGEHVLDLLTRLVDKSLVLAEPQSDGAMRYRLLETLGAYASDRLTAEGDRQPCRRRHARFYLEFAERAEPELWGAEQRVWLDRLEREHGNLRAALQAGLQLEPGGVAIRLCRALWRFWATRGHLSEGRAWIERILGQDVEASPATRGHALNAAAWLALLQADYTAAASRATEALALLRAAGDVAGMAESLMNLAETARQCGDYRRAQLLIDESLALRRRSGIQVGIADALNISGMVLHARGDSAGAADRYAQSLELRRQLGDVRGIASTLANLGEVARGAGDLDGALRRFAESLNLRRELGDARGVATMLGLLGDLARLQGHHQRAESLYQEALELAIGLGAKRQVAACREGLAHLAEHQSACYEPQGSPGLTMPRIGGGSARWAVAPSQTGYRYMSTRAGRRDLADVDPAAGSGPQAQLECEREAPDLAAPSVLTRREHEVAVLVAQGLTNRQIAAALVVSDRTVHSHVRAILTKLGFASRTEIATWLVRSSA